MDSRRIPASGVTADLARVFMLLLTLMTQQAISEESALQAADLGLLVVDDHASGAPEVESDAE